MRLDIRLPLGSLFALVGVLLVIRGLLGGAAHSTAHGGDINIDLWWGIAMGAFGALMLVLARRR